MELDKQRNETGLEDDKVKEVFGDATNCETMEDLSSLLRNVFGKMLKKIAKGDDPFEGVLGPDVGNILTQVSQDFRGFAKWTPEDEQKAEEIRENILRLDEKSEEVTAETSISEVETLDVEDSQ